MKNYSFTCSCGEKMTVQAETKEDAAKKMMEMGQAHLAEKHAGENVPAMTEEEMMGKLVEEM